MYQRIINYETGNSFGVQDETEPLGREWGNLEKAKESLVRIKNHYEFYEEHHHGYKKPDADSPVGVVWHEEYRCIGLELIDDNGDPFLYSPFWVGYFETLHEAKITPNDITMVYTPK